MKKTLLTLCMLVFGVEVWAAKPLIEVPDLPQMSELELYEESEGLFTLKVLEYYKIAVALEYQLRSLGIAPKFSAVQPVFDELEDMDIKILRKYHKIAKSIEDEVKLAPESDRQVLLEQINELEAGIRDTTAVYTIELGNARNKVLDEMVKRLREQERINAENLELIQNQNFVNCYDYKTILSVGAISRIFFSDGKGMVSNDPGLGIQLSVNAGKLLGFWDGFEFRYEYFAPRFFTEYDFGNNNIAKEQWNSNLNSVSAGGKIALNKTQDIVHAVNIYAGYFWANGNIYNRVNSSMNWDGAKLGIEYFAGAPSCRFPVEIFGGLSFYNSFSRDLVFNTDVAGFEHIALSRTHIAFVIGLRYNFWRSAY